MNTTKTVRLLDIAVGSLGYIRKWFYNTYGIAITPGQAIQFAITTVDVLAAKKLYRIHNALSTKLPSHRIRIDERAWLRLGEICKDSWGVLGVEDETILAAIVVCRASTLPIKKAQPK